MRTQDYIESLSLDQLDYLVEAARSRIKVLQEVPKEEYLVVSDSDINWGFFKKDDIEGALAMFCKRVRGGGVYRGNYLQLSIEKFRPHEVEDLLQENKNDS